jgi:hypothetical protein
LINCLNRLKALLDTSLRIRRRRDTKVRNLLFLIHNMQRTWTQGSRFYWFWYRITAFLFRQCIYTSYIIIIFIFTNIGIYSWLYSRLSLIQIICFSGRRIDGVSIFNHILFFQFFFLMIYNFILNTIIVLSNGLFKHIFFGNCKVSVFVTSIYLSAYPYIFYINFSVFSLY